MLMGLSGVGPGSEGLSPDVAQNRLNYLATLESQYANNQNMQNLLNGVREQLEYSANPGAYAEPPQMDFRRMLGGGPGGRMQGMGGRGQRGGGGGPGR